TFRGNDLIEVDDGGIYMRANPSALGAWTSLIGNLQVTEHHSCAYDTNSKIIICGNQDTGAAEQTATDSKQWREISQGDGGKVVVDVTSIPGSSIRYSSDPSLGFFRRRVCDAANNCGTPTAACSTPVVANESCFPKLMIAGGFMVPFYTPL